MRSKMSLAWSLLSKSCSSLCSLCLCGKLASFVRAPNLNASKARRRCSMARAHHLLWLAFAAIWRAPERPLLTRTDRVQRIPELGRNARVRRVLHHAQALAMPDLTAKLKVVALVINRPGAVGLHQNSVIGGRDQLLERQRRCPGQQTDVSHANHRQAIPAFCTQRPSGSILANRMCGLARTQIPSKQSVSDDRRALRGNPLIVKSKSSEAGAVLLASVGHNVHHLAAIA